MSKERRVELFTEVKLHNNSSCQWKCWAKVIFSRKILQKIMNGTFQRCIHIERRSATLKRQRYLGFCYLSSHCKGFQAPWFAVLHSRPLIVSSSLRKTSRASGTAHTPPARVKHVGAGEFASLRAPMMKLRIYISLVKQEQWHAASVEAQSMQPEHLVSLC